MPQLVFLNGTSAGRSIELDRALILGRIDGDVIVDDARVSRRHAAVRIEDGRAVVEDLGSANGTWVNEHRLQEPRVLSSGDTIRVGNTSLEIRLGPITESESRAVRGSPLAVPGVEPSSLDRFGAAGVSRAAPRWSAQSRLIGPMVFAVVVTVATAIALVIYFAAR